MRLAPEHLPLEDAAEVAGGGVESRPPWSGWRSESASSSRLVTSRSVMPQGTIQSKSRRSVVTFSAKPCEVTPCETWTPMAAIFFSGCCRRRCVQTPVQLADALRHHAEVAAGADEDLFEQADVVDRAEVRAFFAGEVAAQIDDRIADELAGAVVGDVAAAIDLVELDAALREEFIAGENVGAVGVAAKREDGRMLEQQQRVADEVLLARGDDLLLDGEAFGIGTRPRWRRLMCM